MSLQPGQTVGRYQILEPLGEGGMAVVYKAQQPSLDRVVALKVIRSGFAEDREFMQRFEREAKAIARLEHPNIVQVHDYDQIDGRPFIAMQCLEGGTLKHRLEALARSGSRLPQREAVRIVAQVAAALDHAHSVDVIHRDVKPSNVMLTAAGRAVVTDFGIAKMLGQTQHTQTGVGIGTPEYMSPEQGQGLPIDRRSDQYSLAVMAYEMLAGRIPFTADTPFAIVLKHMKDPIPPASTFNAEIGGATERVLLKALAKEPADRFESAGAFATALEDAVARDHPATAKTVVSPARVAAAGVAAEPARVGGAVASRRTLLVAGGSAAGLLVLGGIAMALRGGETPAPAATGSAGPATSATTSAPAALTAAPAPTPKPSPTAPAEWGAVKEGEFTRLGTLQASHLVARVGDKVTFWIDVGQNWGCDGTPVLNWTYGSAKIAKPPVDAQLLEWGPKEIPGRKNARVTPGTGGVTWEFGEAPVMPPRCAPGTVVKTDPLPAVQLTATYQILAATTKWERVSYDITNNQGTGFGSIPFGVVKD